MDSNKAQTLKCDSVYSFITANKLSMQSKLQQKLICYGNFSLFLQIQLALFLSHLEVKLTSFFCGNRNFFFKNDLNYYFKFATSLWDLYWQSHFVKPKRKLVCSDEKQNGVRLRVFAHF